MADAFAFAFTAALNPSLLTATMLMLFAEQPTRLMWGYLLGAYTASIGLGMVIVFALQGSDAVSATQNTLSPAADIALGVVFLLVAFVLHGDRDARLRERRRARAEAKGQREDPRWKKVLDRGSPRTAFVVGILLTLPGASYLAGMTRISRQDVSTVETVLAVVAFNVIMLLLIEVPLLGYVVAPSRTRRLVSSFTHCVSGNARLIVTRIALVLGCLLLLRAAITLLS